MLSAGLGTLIWTAIAFLTVLFLLKKFAWKPILASLQEREDFIDKSLKSAEQAKAQMSDLKSENGVSRRMERSYGAFNRSFRLPSEINSDEISAAYKNGVLTILLPKLETAKPKVIPISAP